MRLTTTILFALVSLLAIGATACRTTHVYEGEKREREEIAVLKVPYYADGLYITVENIDGQKVEGEAYAKLGLLPGHHLVAGRVRGFGQDREGFPYAISFVSRSGGTYALDLEQKRFSEKLTVRVFDKDTGEELALVEVWP